MKLTILGDCDKIVSKGGVYVRVLILSCATGEGHNSAARALAETLEAMGETAQVVDFPSLKSEKTSRRVANGYIWPAKHLPYLFGAVYRLGSLLSNSRVKMPVYFANIGMAKYLLRYLSAHPADIIVMPHLFPAETTTYIQRGLRKKGLENTFPKTLAVATDYTCIPFFEETECDACVIAHEDLISEYVKRGMPREKLYPLGIPVSPRFLDPPEKRAARKALSLDESKPVVLIMSGSMGFGRIQVFVFALYKIVKEKAQIVVLCGSNKKLKALLDREFSNAPTVRAVGFTRDVPTYMAAGDILYTKPGGLTSTEAAVCGIPMIHTAPIPGCETRNAAFFERHGMACSEKILAAQLKKGRELVLDQSLRDEMVARQKSESHRDAAKSICLLMQKMCAKTQKEAAE